MQIQWANHEPDTLTDLTAPLHLTGHRGYQPLTDCEDVSDVRARHEGCGAILDKYLARTDKIALVGGERFAVRWLNQRVFAFSTTAATERF